MIEHNSSPLSGTGGVSTTGAEVRIIQSRFTGNSGIGTGALLVVGGNLSVSQTTFDRNVGNGANALSLSGAIGVVRDSAFVQNGGSSFYIGTTFFNSGTVDVINTTFAQNTIGERFSVPKGIAITNSGTMTIVNSTVAGSSAGFFIAAAGSGAIFGSPQGTTRLKNTILRAVSNSPVCAGEITSLGNT